MGIPIDRFWRSLNDLVHKVIDETGTSEFWGTHLELVYLIFYPQTIFEGRRRFSSCFRNKYWVYVISEGPFSNLYIWFFIIILDLKDKNKYI